MIILDEHSHSIILDNIDIPFPVSHFWALDLEMMDFTLKELVLSEELTTGTLAIVVNDYVVEAPADWNILIYSPETSELDVVEFSDLSKHDYSAFSYNHKTHKLVENVVRVVHYEELTTVHTPSLIKNTMLCHPLGDTMWVCIAPTDSYNKYIKGMVIGDLL